MRYLSSLCYALGALVLCANFSSNQSVRGEEAPPINYTGVLISNDGIQNTYENLTISGLIKDIPVYNIPNTPDGKPTLNTTYVRLNEIERIRTISSDPRENIRKFDNRDYVEIIITFKTGPTAALTEQHFLIESTRRIFCDVITATGIVLKKEIAIEAISSLTIESFRAHAANKALKNGKEKKIVEESAARKALCSLAKDELKMLEEASKKSPDKDLSKLTKSVQDKVHYICE